MAEFRTTNNEELCIDRVKKDGFGYREALGFSENDFPKYLALRVALARALKLPKIALNSPQWDDKKLGGESGKEYHLEALTGKGKNNKDDFDIFTRALLYIQHKDELDRDNIDIFSDDKKYEEILGKYIRRGLYELRHSWKSNDCLYQWCLDNLGFDLIDSSTTNDTKQESGKLAFFERLQKYFRQFAININLVNEEDSYRHHICKIELVDSSKIQHFESKAKYLDQEFGATVLIEAVDGVSRTYNIQIAKPQKQWQNLGLAEFESGLESLKGCDFRLGIFAGNSIDKMPFCFDLAKAPHCFVAGTSGSGKTTFLQTLIVCLLQNSKAKITVIDPKMGLDFKIFGNKITLADKVDEVLQDFVDLMEARYKEMSEKDCNNIESLGLSYEVVIVDELNNVIANNNNAKDLLSRLAEKSRQAGIHLVLGTQRPDGTLLRGLKNNIDGKIALKVSNKKESEIILDKQEYGAEKLLGNGDMLIKVGSMSKPKHIFSCLLQDSDIKKLII